MKELDIVVYPWEELENVFKRSNNLYFYLNFKYYKICLLCNIKPNSNIFNKK